MLSHLSKTYQNQVNLVLCILGSDEKNLKLYISIGSVSSVNGQQTFKIRPVSLKSRSPRTSLKEVLAGVEQKNCPKPPH